ncbi:hypothetical protein Afil01_20210 [Actinorhabdospora filicis]|uniref:Uncharacterized protein n=1 Tax=Actinorhabdospora filicis TaxID=1785913 RepID=A0A9W6SKA6_9ACTN|nr:hypothetical protein Afil01_20210 [Actinorhabdospora filicis]
MRPNAATPATATAAASQIHVMPLTNSSEAATISTATTWATAMGPTREGRPVDGTGATGLLEVIGDRVPKGAKALTSWRAPR